MAELLLKNYFLCCFWESLTCSAQDEPWRLFANGHQKRNGAFGVEFRGFAQQPAQAFLNHVVFVGEQ